MPLHPSNEPKIVAQSFRAEQLSQARNLKGMSKRELADVVGKSPAAISQFEMGTSKPDPTTLGRIALALEFPVSFFAHTPKCKPMRSEQCHFRSFKTAPQKVKNAVLASAMMTLELFIWFNQRFNLAPPALDQLKGELLSITGIEQKAHKIREFWGLGEGPLPQLAWVLEKRGICILPLLYQDRKIDAFSTWHMGWPVIFADWVNTPPSRFHFDLAHELVHIVVHGEEEPGDWELEDEANSIASAFLMPRDAFARECPRTWNLQRFLDIKKRWHVSIAAAIRRGRDLGILSEASYKKGCIELRQRGIEEPGEWKLAKPKRVELMLQKAQDHYSLEAIAQEMCIHPRYLEEITSIFTQTPQPKAEDAEFTHGAQVVPLWQRS